MVTWLTRSLIFIVAGAVLAYAVTVHNNTIDLPTTGVILLLVGVFDLLLNFALTMYLRQPVHRDEVSRQYTPGPYPAHRPSRPAPTAHYRPNVQPPATGQRPAAPDDDRYATRPIRRDNPDWH
ncbi:MAG: hypothetical protein ACRDV3_01645 [Acidothermaceae bacterium]